MTVSIEVCDYIATVTLNRPDAMNALDPESVDQLHAIWQQVSSDSGIRVVVHNRSSARSTDLPSVVDLNSPFNAT